MPATERNAVAEDAVNQLASITGNRAIFLLGINSDSDSTDEITFAAARFFAKKLASSKNFRQVTVEVPAIDPQQFINLYLQHRYNFLSNPDREQLQQNQSYLAEQLQQKLYAPFRFGLSLPLSEDPFGLTDNWLASLPLKNLALEPENGLLVHHEYSNGTSLNKTWVFISAELPDSAYDENTQTNIINTVNNAEKLLNKHFQGVELLRTGAVFYAHDARTKATHEVDRIGAVSLIGMLLLLYMVFRSLRPLALGLLSVGFGVTAATVVTIALQGEIHLITLVFGASLIGEAIDYAIQYFAAHLGAGASWHPTQGLRRIGPGLTVALLTSLLGYSALALSPFPALSQIALFAIVGLSAAWLSVFLLLPACLTQPNKHDPSTVAVLPKKILKQWQNSVSRRTVFVIASLLLILAIPGWQKIHADDDIHLLIARSPVLAAQETKIRDLIGLGNSSQFFLIEGSNPDEVLKHEEKLRERLDKLVLEGEIGSYQSISAFIPSATRQAENHALWQQAVFSDKEKFKSLLAKAELRNDIATSQIAAFESSLALPLTVDDWLQAPLSRPYRHLWLGKTTHGFATIVLPQNIRNVKKLEAETAGLPAVTFVDKVGSINTMFKQYRQWSALWLLCVVVLIFALLCVRYGWRQTIIILIPTILAIALTLGIIGYLHITLTLFNMMGLMLVLGVGVNYAIFLYEGGINQAATLAGVLLSAGTTLLSFGMLAFSSMPALSSFGLTLLIGIGVTVLCAPISILIATKPYRLNHD
ncbi:MAG TPA: MMPL family transporter [Methylotenera sp.]|nr:MMPL family transporter [Methylotenera sp.]